MLIGMKRSWGFTLVEILISVTVMGILLTFAVVTLNGSLARARDDDRKTDASAIAARLESLYKIGYVSEDTTWSITQGRYPSASQMRDASKRDEIFKDFELSGRSVSGTSPTNDSIVAPTDTGFDISFGPTVNQYAYIPLRFDFGSGAFRICENPTDDCRRFIIRYRLETEAGSPVHDIRSKNQ